MDHSSSTLCSSNNNESCDSFNVDNYCDDLLPQQQQQQQRGSIHKIRAARSAAMAVRSKSLNNVFVTGSGNGGNNNSKTCNKCSTEEVAAAMNYIWTVKAVQRENRIDRRAAMIRNSSSSSRAIAAATATISGSFLLLPGASEHTPLLVVVSEFFFCVY